MTRMTLLFAATIALLAVPAQAQQTNTGAAVHLNQLIKDVRAFDLREDPELAGRMGDLAALARWRDVSPGARARRAKVNAGFAARLAGIDRSGLNHAQAVNAALLDFVLRDRAVSARFDEAAFPFTNDSGFHTAPAFAARSTRADSMARAKAWIARLDALPDYFSQQEANLRAGMKTGITQPQRIVDDIIATVQATLDNPDFATDFAAPLAALPRATPPKQRAALEQELDRTVRDRVRPAYVKLLAFLRDDYRPAARASLGLWGVPDGKAWYAALVRRYTTTDMTPLAVHQLGLAEVKRIRKEMDAVIKKTGFDGDFAQFLHFLRTDTRFYAKTPDELLRRAAWIAKTADGKLPQFFGRLPRLPYGVYPVPVAIAPHYTSARYWPGDARAHRAGGYMVNTYALDQRPLYALPSLTLHEAVPGHHLQGALAQELEDVPEFRKELYLTAFGEGWALYAEKLGGEMGMYTTPYEEFGRLTYEMWRACRLVMDTGIHAMGWSRERAMACLKDNSALSLHNIETETDRYISWPGQALGYKIGELTILRLRERAEKALGADFDLRAFHDAVLGDGAVTMTMLEDKITRWIKAQQAAARP